MKKLYIFILITFILFFSGISSADILIDTTLFYESGTDLPEDYIKITSGLGDSIPHYFLITPFMYEGNVKGVIELGTSHKFTEIQQEFLNNR